MRARAQPHCGWQKARTLGPSDMGSFPAEQGLALLVAIQQHRERPQPNTNQEKSASVFKHKNIKNTSARLSNLTPG